MDMSMELVMAATAVLAAYFIMRWIKNPLRKIPGPTGLPILGNILSLDMETMHMQFYDMAKKYGPVMKISIFTDPVVIINTTEACLEALVKRGTDFNGRVCLHRMLMVAPKEFAHSSIDDPDHVRLRRLFVKAMKAYGPDAHLECVVQETIHDVVDIIYEHKGEPVDAHQLSNGFVCCVIASMLFGEKYVYTDPVCRSLHQMNEDIIKAFDPMTAAALLDFFPILYHFKFLLRAMLQKLADIRKVTDNFTQQRIYEAKESFDPNQKRGCLDYFIETQQEETDGDGNSSLKDEDIQGLLLDFVTAGMETSLSSLSQAFLDLLHDVPLQKRIQRQIDSRFEPTHIITLNDREKLPLLEAYIYENVRYLSQVPFLIPHMTIRDTQVAGYKIPARTKVLINSFCTAHNQEIYDEPFKVKPERFLDENGKVVPPEHPVRRHLLVFGAGRRKCPGDVLARSRIFLFLASILQKFDIEPAGELPDRDVRNYKISILLTPPPVKVRFIGRQH